MEQAKPNCNNPLLKRLALALFGLFSGVCILELGIRFVAPQGLVTEHFRYESTPQGGPGFRLQPGLWLPGPEGGRINSLGLRGQELPAKSDAQRVLVLGDSFVYGAGVPLADSLPAQLQGLAGDQFEFVNAGTPSYGTGRELAWLETYGELVSADEVLLAVFVGNDFTDNLELDAPRVIDGRLFSGAAAKGSAVKKSARVWVNSSHLYRLLQRRSYGQKDIEKPVEQNKVSPMSAEQQAALVALKDKFAQRQVGRLSIYTPESGVDPRVDLAYDMTRLGLDGIASWCNQRKMPLRVVLIPDVLQVEPDMRERALHQAGRENVSADFERPQRELVLWCEQLELECVDLLERMRAETENLGHSLYLFGDSHWNAEGHQLAAELVKKALY